MRFALALILTTALAPNLVLGAPAAWTVDKAASRLSFSSSVSGQPFTGVFRQWDAAIRFDPKRLADSSVAATIYLASAASGSGDRDALLPDQDWFWVSHFPKATFTAKGFRQLGPGRYAAPGVLSLRGVAKPLTLPFSLAISGGVARMSAQVDLNRLAFGVGQGEWQATDTVPATVTVKVDLTARRTP